MKKDKYMLNLGSKEAVMAFLDRQEARKAKFHPEHPWFVETCRRCLDFRKSMFVAH